MNTKNRFGPNDPSRFGPAPESTAPITTRWDIAALWREPDRQQDMATTIRVDDRELVNATVAQLRLRHGSKDGFSVSVVEKTLQDGRVIYWRDLEADRKSAVPNPTPGSWKRG